MRLVMAVALAALLALSCAGGPEAEPITKSSGPAVAEPQALILVADQEAPASSVLISEIDSPGYGWVVVRCLAGGEAGPVLGLAPILPGRTRSLPVRLSAAGAGAYVASLHVDRGTRSLFEFPGPDEPLLLAGLPLSARFSILN